MSGQKKSPEELEIERRLTQLVARIGELKNQEARINTTFAEKIHPHVVVRDAQLRPIEREVRAAIAELVALLDASRNDASTLTRKLSSGEVTLATSGTALEVTDEDEFMKLARKYRMVLQVSVQKPRALQKTLIKAAMKNYPNFFRRFGHLLVQPRKTMITIKPTHFDGEVKQEVSQTTVPYPAPQGSFDQPALFL